MAGITLAQAEAQLALWLSASTAISSGQSYTVDSRAFTLADAAKIQQNIEYWDSKVRQLSATATSARSGPYIRGATPV